MIRAIDQYIELSGFVCDRANSITGVCLGKNGKDGTDWTGVDGSYLMLRDKMADETALLSLRLASSGFF